MKSAIGTYFSVRKYGKEVKLTPLFVETAVSILAGLFMLFWGIVFFANSLFQLSLFTQLRNQFRTDQQFEEDIKDIYCIGVDPETVLAYEDGSGRLHSYDMVAAALEGLIDYALAHPENEKIIVGIDFLFFQGNEEELTRIRQAFVRIPENLYIVFGISLVNSPDSFIALDPGFITDHITIPAMSLRAAYVETLSQEEKVRYQFPLERHITFGHLHLAEGTIKSGFTQELEPSAIGYLPLAQTQSNIFFPSLVFMMYAMGNLSVEKDNSLLYSDFYGGQIATGTAGDTFETDFDNGLKQATSAGIESYRDFNYINFMTGKSIDSFPSHYLWISSIDVLSEKNNYMGISSPPPFLNYLKFSSVLDLKDNLSKTKYFFIVPTQMPSFFLSQGKEDIIYTLASENDKYTYQKESVIGAMAHIQALANLLNNQRISTSPLITTLLTLIILFCLFILIWRKNLLPSLGYTVGILFLCLLVTFLFFLFFNLFIPIKHILVLAILLFASVAGLRFVITSKTFDQYETAASIVLPPEIMNRIRKEEERTMRFNWRSTRRYRDAILMVIQPKAVPEPEGASSDGNEYVQIYQRYIKNMFREIEKFQGGHIPLTNYGFLAFWNIPLQDDPENTVDNVLSCTQSVINALKDWEAFVNRTLGKKLQSKEYKAALDIVIHGGDCFAGCFSAEDAPLFSLSGNIVNEAISLCTQQSRDSIPSLTVSHEFLDYCKNQLSSMDQCINRINLITIENGKIKGVRKWMQLQKKRQEI